MVDESLPVGAFADITIGDWRGEEQAEEAVGKLSDCDSR